MRSRIGFLRTIARGRSNGPANDNNTIGGARRGGRRGATTDSA